MRKEFDIIKSSKTLPRIQSFSLFIDNANSESKVADGGLCGVKV